MRSECLRTSPDPMTGVLIRRGKFEQGNTHEELGVGGRRWVVGKGCQEPPEPGRGRKETPRETSEGSRPCPHLDFGFLASRTVRKYISTILSQLVCGYLLQQLQATNKTLKGHQPMRTGKQGETVTCHCHMCDVTRTQDPAGHFPPHPQVIHR